MQSATWGMADGATYWFTFYRNGRPALRRNCAILCWAQFEDQASGRNVNVVLKRNDWKEHVEHTALQYITDRELQEGLQAKHVLILVSFSPCTRCAELIVEFCKHRPNCKMHIMFSCIYRHFDMEHRESLRMLHESCCLAKLAVLTRAEWRMIADLIGIPFIVKHRNRDTWDAYWQHHFNNVLYGSYGFREIQHLEVVEYADDMESKKLVSDEEEETCETQRHSEKSQDSQEKLELNGISLSEDDWKIADNIVMSAMREASSKAKLNERLFGTSIIMGCTIAAFIACAIWKPI
ncbi:uncharacterized protein [Periplaneta americana]|uniref:uncharacterized protein n=1 Tax=Periplaneta americana TaxID=6978 RepID=UPI0037E8C4CC